MLQVKQPDGMAGGALLDQVRRVSLRCAEIARWQVGGWNGLTRVSPFAGPTSGANPTLSKIMASKEGRRLVLREGGANLGDEVWGTAVDGINDARVIYRFFLNLYSMPTERAKLTSVWVTLVVELAL